MMTPGFSLFLALLRVTAGGQIFSLAYLRGQSGLAYLMVYPVLFFGRAGTTLGVDGAIARGMRNPGV